MTVHYGRPERHGLSTVPVAARHFLLWLALTLGMGASIALILVWVSPVLLGAVIVAGLLIVAACRLRARVRDVERWVDAEDAR